MHTPAPHDLALKIDETIKESAGKFASILTQYKWELLPDSQLQAAKQALTKNDYIMKIACGDPDAVHDALIKSAILGLDLTEGKRQGWLLPRKNAKAVTVIQLQVGYKGVEAIHQNMGVIDRLAIRVVRENDPFEWSGDDQEKPKHDAQWFDSDEKRGAIIGAYAVTYYPDKSIHVTTAPISEIYEKHRDRSDSWKSYQAKLKKNESPYPPPWVTDEKSMVEKTMAYVASKQWPANIRNKESSSKILETLHEIDASDYSYLYTLEQKEAFNEFINANDSLGLWLFSRRMDIEGYSALFNTFPKGQKVKRKTTVRKMEFVGVELYNNIIEGITKNDPGLIKENLDGSLEITAKLVKASLNEQQKSVFSELYNPNIPTIKDAYEALKKDDIEGAMDIASSLGSEQVKEIQDAIDNMDKRDHTG
jgi:phage RecT family recombinase